MFLKKKGDMWWAEFEVTEREDMSSCEERILADPHALKGSISRNISENVWHVYLLVEGSGPIYLTHCSSATSARSVIAAIASFISEARKTAGDKCSS